MLPIASQNVRSGAALKCIQLCTIRNGRCWCQCSLWHYLPPENICVPVQLEYVKCCLSFGQCLGLWYLSKHLFFSNLGTGMLLPNVNWRFYHFLHLLCSDDTDFKVQWWAKKKVAFKTSSFQNSLWRVINFIYCLFFWCPCFIREFLTKQYQAAAEGQNSVAHIGLYILNTTMRFWLC